ncbi:MAG: type IA DNA topoisomerase [Burkholderiaceae bacterium]|nr:MAG: type IA DNA topoisomerase [Burkholderiaceae bacterium]
MSKDLVVIEAPGKLRAVYRSFAELRCDVEVVATIGHIYENSPTFDRLGIAMVDGELVETERTPQRLDSFAYLQERLKACRGRMLVATDDDQEGHVIAQDIAELVGRLRLDRPLLRVKPQAMTASAWKLALDHAAPIDPAAALAGTARRIADRLIAASLSDVGKGRIVGRVQSALIGLAEQGRLQTRVVHVQCAAADGGRPFTGRGTVSPAVWSSAHLTTLPPLDVAAASSEPLQQPFHGGDALLALHDQLGMSIAEAGELLQSMYEAGEVSYPRTAARGLRRDGIEAVAMLARSKGIRQFQSGVLEHSAAVSGESHQGLHLPLGPMIDKLNLGRPLRLCRDMREAAGVVIARQTIESGATVMRERPVLAALPAWARELDWSRESRAPVFPWRSSDKRAGRAVELDAALVHTQIQHELGRPSTWGSHATRAAASGYLRAEGDLTLHGRIHASGLPVVLKDPRTSVAIERVLSDPDLSVYERVSGALKLAMGGDQQAASDLLQSLSTELAHATPQFGF